MLKMNDLYTLSYQNDNPEEYQNMIKAKKEEEKIRKM